MFQVKKIIKHYNHLPQYTQSHVVNSCSSSSSVSFILDKDTITFEDLTKQKSLYLGQQANKQSKKFTYTAFLALNSLTLGIKILSILLLQGGFLHMGDLFLIVSRTEGSRSCFLYLISHQLFLQFSSVQFSHSVVSDSLRVDFDSVIP